MAANTDGACTTPKTPKGRGKSNIFAHITVLTEDPTTGKYTAQCNYCKSGKKGKITGDRKATSNVLSHLRTQHQEILDKYDADHVSTPSKVPSTNNYILIFGGT